MVPDKTRLCTHVVRSLTSESNAVTLWRLQGRGADLLIRHSVQIDYSDAAFKSTLAALGDDGPAQVRHCEVRRCA